MMSQTQTDQIAAGIVAPDWALIPDTIRCPLCEYDLRGLREALCPECGYRFAWAELLDEQLRNHPYLFELARRRLRRSFIKTNLAGWWPWRFWRSIRPQQRINLRRLKWYWLTSAALFFVALGMLVLCEPVPFVFSHSPDVAQGLEDYFQFFARTNWEFEGTLLLAGLMYALWPVLTYLTLRIFAQSMHRAMVRPEHVVRCTLYSCDAGFFMFWLLFALCALWVWLVGDTGQILELRVLGTTTRALLLAAMIYATIAAMRLAVSYRLYLRFPHPRSTAIASQVIVLLFAAAVIMTLWSVT
jgi:hypothetical protein